MPRSGSRARPSWPIAVSTIPVGECLMLEVLSWVDAERGLADRAAILLGATDARWRLIGSAITVHGPQLAAHHDRCVDALWRRLGSQRYDKLVGVGAHLDPDEAVAFALEPKTTVAGGLSAREREVAMRIHRGMSNREIAEELVLSVRTVDTRAAHPRQARLLVARSDRGLVRGDGRVRVADYVVLRIPPPTRRHAGERHRRRPSRCATSGIATANPCASRREGRNPMTAQFAPESSSSTAPGWAQRTARADPARARLGGRRARSSSTGSTESMLQDAAAITAAIDRADGPVVLVAPPTEACP